MVIEPSLFTYGQLTLKDGTPLVRIPRQISHRNDLEFSISLWIGVLQGLDFSWPSSAGVPTNVSEKKLLKQRRLTLEHCSPPEEVGR